MLTWEMAKRRVEGGPELSPLSGPCALSGSFRVLSLRSYCQPWESKKRYDQHKEAKP